MAFKLIADPEVTEYREMPISSQAYTLGDLVAYSRTAGTVVPATSSTTVHDVFGVAMETQPSTATQLLVAIISSQQRWVCAATNTPVTTDNYQRMVLTDQAHVNNTHSDSSANTAVVTQVGVVNYNGVTSAVFQFNGPIGVS